MRVFASTETTSICILVLAAALCGAGQAAAQQPSEDQIAAVKSNCRSDFMAKCWGVPRGGTEAFQCLKKNLASLSAPCQQAVQAAIAAATPNRLPQSRRVHRLRQHSRRPLQPLLLRLRPHLRRKRPSQAPQLRRRRARLSPLLNRSLRLQQRPRKSRERQPILPRRNLPHPQRLRRRRKHRQRRKSQTLAPPRSSRRPHSRPRHRQPLSASSRRERN
jgi:hypothetical protein